MNNQETNLSRQDARVEQAETRTDQANTRTQEANTRTDQANTRTKQAEVRTEEANTRTDQANTRTEQAEARSVQAILASELRYRRLFETAQDGILILDADTGQVVDTNPFMKDLLGYSQAEFFGKKLWEIGPFKSVAASKIAFAELQRKDRIRYEGLPLETKDGRRVEVEFISNAYLMDEKRLIQCNIRDITQRKQAEKTAIRLAAIVESSDDAIIGQDLDGVVLSWNAGAENIFGYSAAEMVGRSMTSLFPADRLEQENQLLEKIKRGESVRHFETVRLAKGGRQVDVTATISPIKDSAGKIVGASKVTRDITERRKLEAQIRQSQKMDAIGQLAGGVAHDFNNILAVIQMQSDLLKSGGNLSTDQFDFTEEIGAAVQRGAALIRQLLLFSRNEILQLHDLDLNQSLSNMTKMLQRILGENVQMQFKFAPQSLFIHADAGMMDQVLMNLAINSRDAMPQGGRLIIETSIAEFDEAAVLQSPQARPGSFVCLSVSDTGCGIPAEVLPRIFEPFFTTKGVGKGTGLGLPTVFGIVQQHQGWIHVYSEPGHGTIFRIYLPWLSGMSERVIAQKMLSVPIYGGTETILLVEDDAVLRVSVCKALSQLGYRLIEAGNGAEALTAWQQHRAEIQLVLTDLVMPGGMNGKELAERLLKENPELKVIYASGYSAEVADKNFPLEEGVNFLSKPFQTFRLAQTVRQIMDANMHAVSPAG
jgi:two-component system cell cycle sensor histidine kinase/response regulator CckA